MFKDRNIFGLFEAFTGECIETVHFGGATVRQMGANANFETFFEIGKINLTMQFLIVDFIEDRSAYLQGKCKKKKKNRKPFTIDRDEAIYIYIYRCLMLTCLGFRAVQFSVGNLYLV